MPGWLKIGTAVVSILLVGVLAFGAYWVFRLQGNISKAALGAGSDKTEGALDDSRDRMQILILGSDTRDGKNAQYGTSDDATGYGHSDVMMLMDISAASPATCWWTPPNAPTRSPSRSSRRRRT